MSYYDQRVADCKKRKQQNYCIENDSCIWEDGVCDIRDESKASHKRFFGPNISADQRRTAKQWADGQKRRKSMQRAAGAGLVLSGVAAGSRYVVPRAQQAYAARAERKRNSQRDGGSGTAKGKGRRKSRTQLNAMTKSRLVDLVMLSQGR